MICRAEIFHKKLLKIINSTIASIERVGTFDKNQRRREATSQFDPHSFNFIIDMRITLKRFQLKEKIILASVDKLSLTTKFRYHIKTLNYAYLASSAAKIV